jgi:hypothetical protein
VLNVKINSFLFILNFLIFAPDFTRRTMDSLLPKVVDGGVAQGQQDRVEGQAHQPQALLLRVQGQVVHADTNNNNVER